MHKITMTSIAAIVLLASNFSEAHAVVRRTGPRPIITHNGLRVTPATVERGPRPIITHNGLRVRLSALVVR